MYSNAIKVLGEKCVIRNEKTKVAVALNLEECVLALCARLSPPGGEKVAATKAEKSKAKSVKSDDEFE